MYIRSLRPCFCRLLRSRSGASMVEAAIAMPIIILTAMLLLRLFTFYLEILGAGISEHRDALEAWDSYSGAGFRKYSSGREVKMLRGGLLHMDVSKRIDTNTYLINEDVLVRAGDVID